MFQIGLDAVSSGMTSFFFFYDYIGTSTVKYSVVGTSCSIAVPDQSLPQVM